ncbi:MAG TPA: KH domain-containing protein [Synergistaceae bacterium]|nr:KH domain-containing protein [Synergistaceae bacterium]
MRISLASGDVGRIIGKKGATINALRQLTRASAAKAGDTVDVDVVEEA